MADVKPDTRWRLALHREKRKRHDVSPITLPRQKRRCLRGRRAESYCSYRSGQRENR